MSFDGASMAYEQAMRVRSVVIFICSPQTIGLMHAAWTKVQARFGLSHCLEVHYDAPCYAFERSRTVAVPTVFTK